jgi:hypothetical protein
MISPAGGCSCSTLTTDFVRKEIGNGAPNDGFGRDEVHGWAFGSLNTGGATVTYYLDNVALIVRTTIIDDFEDGLPSGEDADGNGIGFVTWGDFWNGTTVAITTTWWATTIRWPARPIRRQPPAAIHRNGQRLGRPDPRL